MPLPRPTVKRLLQSAAPLSLLALLGAAPVNTPASNEGLSPELSPPVKILAGNEPIDVEIGHAAPFFTDIDKDGKPDLLVGQFGGGKLRIYKNTGSAKEPAFDKYEFMKAGADLGVVPAG